jgi:subtilisin family serine protease
MWNGSAYIPSEDADVRDDYGHGTHVAGIAGAATNNGVGIAGIAWGAQVMPVKVLDQYGNGWYSDIAAGIIYAADNGASVINLSLGGESDSQTLRAAVDYARNRGAVVVAATGNTGGAVLYPAAYEPVLAVAATDANDQRASFSNYGPQVDLSAPGEGIYSTWCRPDPVSSLCLGNYYFTKSGTSMAVPHVAGVAALVRSRWPDLSASAVISTLLETAQDVDEVGFDPFTGWGRVNAYVPTGLWGDLAAPYSARCGDPFSYILSYGNDGPQPILSVTLTLELAAGLVSSQPLMQEIGALLPQSGPLIQQWTAVAPCANLSNTRDYAATATIRGMLEGQPALAHVSRRIVRIVAPLFLPLIFQSAP